MKNTLLLLSAILFISVAVLPGCAKQQTTVPTPVVSNPPPAPPPVPEPPVRENPISEPESLTINGDSWEFTLPTTGWIRRTSPDVKDIVMLINLVLKNRIVMTSDKTKETVPTLVLKEIRNATDAGFKKVSSKSVKSNDTTFTLILFQATDSSDHIVDMMAWIGVKNSTAYILRCGGVKDASDQSTTCSSVFKTLKID